jgi:histidine triad (HIT) family protein
MSQPDDDPNNLFARILRGNMRCHKVYEDDHALAFLDIRPLAPGHTLVLVKAPVSADHSFTMPIINSSNEDFAHMMQVAQSVARAAMQVFGADGITIQQDNRRAGGKKEIYLHAHVIPRKAGVPLAPSGNATTAVTGLLVEQAARLSAAIAPVPYRGIPLISREELLAHAAQIKAQNELTREAWQKAAEKYLPRSDKANEPKEE